MNREKMLSLSAVAVLKAIADGCCYGFDIMDSTGLASGTVYPILGRMQESGLLRSRWEPLETALKEKRPVRRYYEITPAGVRALEAAIRHYRTLGGRIPVRTPVVPLRQS